VTKQRDELTTLIEQLERSSTTRVRQSAAARLAQLFAAGHESLQRCLHLLELLIQLAQDCQGKSEHSLTQQLVLSCITNLLALGYHEAASVNDVSDLVVQAILTSSMMGDEGTLSYALAAAVNLTSTPSGAHIATRLVAVGCDTLLKEKCESLAKSKTKADLDILKYANGLLANMKHRAKKVTRSEKGIAQAAKRAAAEMVKAATDDAKPAQPGEMESRVPKRAAAEVVKAETVDAKPAQPGREVVHQHQFPSRRCRPSLPSPACSQLDLKRSLGDDSIRGGADSCKVNDAAASPLDHASTGKIPNTDHEAKIARALACSTGPRRFSPGLCQASITGMESFGPTATLPIVDVASRLRARPTRAEDTIDIMQRVPVHNMRFKPACNAPFSACRPEAPVRSSSVLPPIGASWGAVMQLQAC